MDESCNSSTFQPQASTAAVALVIHAFSSVLVDYLCQMNELERPIDWTPISQQNSFSLAISPTGFNMMMMIDNISRHVLFSRSSRKQITCPVQQQVVLQSTFVYAIGYGRRSASFRSGKFYILSNKPHKGGTSTLTRANCL